MRSEHSDVLLIGIGNEYRRDDGVGLIVAKRLQGQTPAGVSIIEQTGEGAALLEAWRGHRTVFLVDAACSGAAPGTIHRLDARGGKSSSRLFHCSTHAIGVAEAIKLARALHQLPSRLLLYGIEGKDFSAGVGLCVEVEEAAGTVTAMVLEDLRALTGDVRAGERPAGGRMPRSPG